MQTMVSLIECSKCFGFKYVFSYFSVVYYNVIDVNMSDSIIYVFCILTLQFTLPKEKIN